MLVHSRCFMFVSLPVANHMTSTLRLKGETSAADFSVKLNEKMTAFSTLNEFSSSTLKVSSALPVLHGMPVVSV